MSLAVDSPSSLRLEPRVRNALVDGVLARKIATSENGFASRHAIQVAQRITAWAVWPKPVNPIAAAINSSPTLSGVRLLGETGR